MLLCLCLYTSHQLSRDHVLFYFIQTNESSKLISKYIYYLWFLCSLRLRQIVYMMYFIHTMCFFQDQYGIILAKTGWHTKRGKNQRRALSRSSFVTVDHQLTIRHLQEYRRSSSSFFIPFATAELDAELCRETRFIDTLLEPIFQ